MILYLFVRVHADVQGGEGGSSIIRQAAQGKSPWSLRRGLEDFVVEQIRLFSPLPPVMAHGLSNEAGENNCFLNAGVQVGMGRMCECGPRRRDEREGKNHHC